VVLNWLPAKLEDPYSISIPYMIESISIDTSVSLTPYSIFKRLILGKLRLTSISLQLANHSIKYPFVYFRGCSH